MVGPFARRGRCGAGFRRRAQVRWSRKGTGKRGGVRVIYFNRPAHGEIWLLLIYAKTDVEALRTAALNTEEVRHVE